MLTVFEATVLPPTNHVNAVLRAIPRSPTSTLSLAGEFHERPSSTRFTHRRARCWLRQQTW